MAIDRYYKWICYACSGRKEERRGSKFNNLYYENTMKSRYADAKNPNRRSRKKLKETYITTRLKIIQAKHKSKQKCNSLTSGM